MKKTNYLKKALIQVTFVSTIFLIASCSNNQKPEDTKDVAEEHNDAKFDTNKQEKDAQFLVNAAEINLEQIELGQLAQQIGRTKHVKELGKMMEDVHTKSLNDLNILAKSKMVSIPSSPTDNAKDAYKTLNKKSGNDFDEAYADMMVSTHKDAIDVFEKASTNGNDTDIKNWATVSLPQMRSHLDHSIDCQKKCNKI
jgi:putative membrane protein